MPLPDDGHADGERRLHPAGGPSRELRAVNEMELTREVRCTRHSWLVRMPDGPGSAPMHVASTMYCGSETFLVTKTSLASADQAIKILKG